MKDAILALTKLRRSASNLSQIQDQLSEIRELADGAAAAAEALRNAREIIDELLGAEGSGNPLVPWFDAIIEAASAFEQAIAGVEEVDLDDLVSEAEGLAGDYESSLEDREISADDRQGTWDNLMDALVNIADVM